MILHILIPALAAYAITDVFEFAWWLVKKIGAKEYPFWGWLSLKPFDCRSCLSFWFALAASILTGNELWQATLYGFAATTIAEFIHFTLKAIKKQAND